MYPIGAASDSGLTNAEIHRQGRMPNEAKVLDPSFYRGLVANPFVDPCRHLGCLEPQWQKFCLPESSWGYSTEVQQEREEYGWFIFDPRVPRNLHVNQARPQYFPLGLPILRDACFGKYASMSAGIIPSLRSAIYFQEHLQQLSKHGDTQWLYDRDPLRGLRSQNWARNIAWKDPRTPRVDTTPKEPKGVPFRIDGQVSLIAFEGAVIQEQTTRPYCGHFFSSSHDMCGNVTQLEHGHLVGTLAAWIRYFSTNIAHHLKEFRDLRDKVCEFLDQDCQEEYAILLSIRSFGMLST